MNLVERAQKILLQPKQEWYVIYPEPDQPAQLYPNYIIPLAAIGPIARIIGLVLFGAGLYLAPVTSFIPYVIIGSVVLFALDLGSVDTIGIPRGNHIDRARTPVSHFAVRVKKRWF